MIRSLTLPFLLATLAATGSAQTPCHAENDGPNFNDLVSMGGPNLLLGVRFVAPTSFTCTEIEVFTGETTGTNSVAIWSHDAPNNQPGSLSGIGSWSMSATNSWQGATLGAPVALTAGQTYWMVWGCVNASQASVDVPMGVNGQPYRGSFDGGANWSGPFQFTDRHWKFRLYGSCGGIGTAICFGDGSASPCPCGNTSTDGGCLNSVSGGAGNPGAILSIAGSASVGSPNLTLTCAGVLTQPGLMFQGDSAVGGGTGAPFGDGLRCCATNLIRLALIDPPPQPEPVTVNFTISTTPAGVGAGDDRCYQYWYRDPGGPCGSNFNLSNGVTVTWQP